MTYTPWLDVGRYPKPVQELMQYQRDGQWVGDCEHGIHAALLYDLGIALNAQQILELGTRFGKSTRVLLEVIRVTGGHLWTVDKEESDWSRMGILDPVDQMRITKVVSDDRELIWSRKVDLLFIDSSHKYEHTLEQMSKYYLFVKTPGVMVLADTDAHFEQKRAVQDWAEERRLGYVLDTRNQGVALFFKPEFDLQWRDDPQKPHRWER